MAVNNDNFDYIPKPSPLRIFRERGTMRIVLAAVALYVAYYVYDSVRTNNLLQVKWPALASDTNGLLVLGLRDKDQPGWRHKYVARESNHAWQLRYNEDEDPNGRPAGGDSEGGDKTEERDRGTNNPGAVHSVNSGAVVPLEEIIQNCPVVMTGPHFSGAYVEEKRDLALDRTYWVLHLDLTDEGRSRYYQFSKGRDDERLVFLLNKEILTCPKMDHLYVTSLTIDPIWIKEDAEKLAKFINEQKK